MKLVTFIVAYTIGQVLLIKFDFYSFEIGFASIYFGIGSVLLYEMRFIFEQLLRFWVWFGHACEKYLKANKEFQ